MWYQKQIWSGRLLAEQELMTERFPQFVLTERDGGSLAWTGIIEPVQGHEFVVSIRYPNRYPYKEPKVFVDEPSLRSGAPHRYLDGSLCVHRKRWDPKTGTAASIVPLAATWLALYLNWAASGEKY